MAPAANSVWIVVDHYFEVSGDVAWKLIGNFGGAHALGAGFISRLESEGEGVGATRTLHLLAELGGGGVVERQVARDERGMYYSYELADAGPLRIDGYLGSVHVVPTAQNACRVTWTNRYRVREPAELKAMRGQSMAILALIERNTRAALHLEVQGSHS